MVVTIISIISKVLFWALAVYGAYYFVTGWLGIIKKNKVVFKKTKNYNHFAVLVPARNEGLVIEDLIMSLYNQDYPEDKYEIYVIPNNCTDDTETVAKRSGAKIIECNVPTKTKGDVLKYTFEKLKNNKKIDAYVVFDADNIVHPNFLKKMNECLDSGYNCAEGFRDAKNASDNWLSGSYNLFYLYQNIFFNRARGAFKSSCSINGTGFMIRKSYIDKHGFDTYTLTEDVEFSGQCALRHEPIAFVEDAITYDEYPTSFKISWKQRKRWSAGSMDCCKRYSWKLLKDFFKTGNMFCLDMAISYFGPIALILNALNIILIILLKILKYHEISLWGMVVAYIFTILLQIFMLVYKKKDIISVIPAILLFPVFIYSWAPINVICLIKKQTKWDEIKHDKKVDVKKLIK